MINRFASAVFGALLLAPAAQAGTWYVGLGYAFDQAKDSIVGGTSLATAYPAGGEVRIGWEYDWYLAFEARYKKGFGHDGSIHSNVSSPSFAVVLMAPRSISHMLFVTAGATHITIKSNYERVTTVTDTNTPQTTTTTIAYEPYPSISQTTWFAGGGVRYCIGQHVCPRAELGYRGSAVGGFYAGAGLDIRLP